MRFPEDRRYAEITVRVRIEGDQVWCSHVPAWCDRDYHVHELKPTYVRIRAIETLSWAELRQLAARMLAYVGHLQHDRAQLPRGMYWREMAADRPSPAPPQGATGVVLTDEVKSDLTPDPIKETTDKIKNRRPPPGGQRRAKRGTALALDPSEYPPIPVLPGQEALY